MTQIEVLPCPKEVQVNGVAFQMNNDGHRIYVPEAGSRWVIISLGNTAALDELEEEGYDSDEYSGPSMMEFGTKQR